MKKRREKNNLIDAMQKQPFVLFEPQILNERIRKCH